MSRGETYANRRIQGEPRVHLCSKEAAEAALASERAALFTHLVSIGEPGSDPPCGFEDFEGEKLRLEFDDVTEIGGWASIMAGYQPPRASDALALAVFYRRKVLAHPAPFVLIHCAQGISRSSAATLALFFAHRNNATEAAEALLSLKSEDPLSPNRLFVSLLDDELGAGGQLIKAAGLYILMQDNEEATIDRRRDEYGG
jgi:predicted protein tyrosine phosphatase